VIVDPNGVSGMVFKSVKILRGQLFLDLEDCFGKHCVGILNVNGLSSPVIS